MLLPEQKCKQAAGVAAKHLDRRLSHHNTLGRL